MALSDLFYPGNPERRNKVVRLSAKLSTLMESNFKRTNDLIDCIHKYIPGQKFMKVKVNHNGTVKENCNVIIGRLNEIQTYVEAKIGEIRRKVDSQLYNKLVDVDTKFMERVRIAKNVAKVCDAFMSIASIVVVVLIAKGKILATIATKMSLVAKSVIGGVVFSVLILAIDAIVSAILGAIERSKLEQAIKELEDVIREFEPASDKFNREIERLIIRVEDEFE